MKRLKGGNFLKKTIADWNDKVNNMSTPKFFLYGAHDLSGEKRVEGIFGCEDNSIFS
jgi:hypothetical protein